MVDATQNAANLRSAEQLVAIRLGIDTQGGDWRTGLAYAARVAYENALAAYIVAHPSAFADATVSTAQWVSLHGNTPLADDSFDYGDFVSSVVDNVVAAGASVAGIGTGALNLAGMAKWLIPAAGVAVIVILLVNLNRKASRA